MNTTIYKINQLCTRCFKSTKHWTIQIGSKEYTLEDLTTEYLCEACEKVTQ